jgi:F-box and leucine-rich repeat protein GRR1
MASLFNDARTRRQRSPSTESASSTSTSPERQLIDDDAESFVIDDNESVSSLAPSDVDEDMNDSRARDIEEQNRISPISRLPAEIMLAIFGRLSAPSDLRSCMLVSREWAKNSVQLLWHRPQTGNWISLHSVVQSIRNANTYFDYYNHVKRLNLSALGNAASDGTLLPFAACKRIERLTLTNCNKLTDLSVARMIQGNRSLLALDITSLDSVTDVTMHAVAENCLRLQGLNITNCRKITDDSLEHVARNCRYVKRVR